MTHRVDGLKHFAHLFVHQVDGLQGVFDVVI